MDRHMRLIRLLQPGVQFSFHLRIENFSAGTRFPLGSVPAPSYYVFGGNVEEAGDFIEGSSSSVHSYDLFFYLFGVLTIWASMGLPLDL